MKICQRAAFVFLTLYFLSYAVTLFAEVPVVVTCEQPGYAVQIIVDHGKMADAGSGSLIRCDLVLTAAHVLDDYTDKSTIYVAFVGDLAVEAEIVKQNKMQDIAVLSIPPVLMPTIKISQTDPKEGDEISIFGFAHGTKFSRLDSRLYKWYDFSKNGNGSETAFSVKGMCIDGMSGGPAVMGGILVGTLTGTDSKRVRVPESYCPNASKINKFLKGFDLNKFDGIIEVE